jgi:hypothetical protein
MLSAWNAEPNHAKILAGFFLCRAFNVINEEEVPDNFDKR